MAKLTAKAFSAVQKLPGENPWLMTFATSPLAHQVRQQIGRDWDTDDLGWQHGWRKAKKAGVRVVKVTVTAA